MAAPRSAWLECGRALNQVPSAWPGCGGAFAAAAVAAAAAAAACRLFPFPFSALPFSLVRSPLFPLPLFHRCKEPTHLPGWPIDAVGADDASPQVSARSLTPATAAVVSSSPGGGHPPPPVVAACGGAAAAAVSRPSSDPTAAAAGCSCWSCCAGGCSCGAGGCVFSRRLLLLLCRWLLGSGLFLSDHSGRLVAPFPALPFSRFRSSRFPLPLFPLPLVPFSRFRVSRFPLPLFPLPLVHRCCCIAYAALFVDTVAGRVDEVA
jgi:hypothetical protein